MWYLCSMENKTRACVSEGVYVAGTELSHLCVVMTNQHVNWGHPTNGPVKWGFCSWCVDDKELRAYLLRDILKKVQFCIVVIKEHQRTDLRWQIEFYIFFIFLLFTFLLIPKTSSTPSWFISFIQPDISSQWFLHSQWQVRIQNDNKVQKDKRTENAVIE